MKAKLRKLVDRIVALEKKCRAGIEIEKNMDEITSLLATLSADEVLEIDNYITEKGLLTE